MENDNKFSYVVRSQFRKLGTDIDIRIIIDDVDQKNAAENDLEKAKKMYNEFSDIFSRFEKESELSKLNDALGRFNFASAHMREIVSLCLRYNKRTEGFYDPRILTALEKIGYGDDFEKGTRKLQPVVADGNILSDQELDVDLKVAGDEVFFGVRMDFSGIAKGYITDQISEFLIKRKIKNFLVDSGGDMFMYGVDEKDDPWTVNVEGIDEKKLIFAINNKAIATSGIGRRRWEIKGRRFHHIINPKNPQQFSFELKSVSVIADNTTDADVLAKTIFLMGREDGMLYVKEHDIAAVILDYRGTAWISPKAKKFVC